MRKAVLFLFIVLLAFGCSSSSNDTSRTWQTANFNGADVVLLKSMIPVTGGASVGGMWNNDKWLAKLWMYNGKWNMQGILQDYVGPVDSQVVENDDSRYISVNIDRGYVYRYKPSTGNFESLKTETLANVVHAVAINNGILYAAGRDVPFTITLPGNGQVWKYEGGQWKTLNITGPLNPIGISLNGPKDVFAIAFSNGEPYFMVADKTKAPSMFYTANSVLVYRNDELVTTNFPKVISINSLISDGKGSLYAGGIDYDYNGQVWQYKNGVWTSLGLQGANRILSLAIDGNGILYAGGTYLKNSAVGQVWMYSNGKWTATDIPGSRRVELLAVGQDNVLYAAGVDTLSVYQVWMYK